jgi:carbonic anhydrase/acetyltransferase-like protein (isoleucine patch superfamily)
VIDERCIGSDVDRSRISPQAEVSGSSYITGKRTVIEAGAVVRDSRVHDAAIGAGATVIDSILIAQSHHEHEHRCDAAGRCVVRGADQPAAGAGAEVSGCTLIDTSIGARSRVVDTWAQDCRIGDDCDIRQAKIIITNTASQVTVQGPTEISEAFLGHHTIIDRRGYLEGIFSNKFHRLALDAGSGKLKVVETIDLPHVAKYGVNTVNSTNSGKLMPQGGKPLSSFGKVGGLWGGLNMLSHEQIELAPCCFVVPWTKVVGQSPQPHATDEQLVNDELTTYLMPFSMAGHEGDLTRGLVMPGELSTGLGTKQRKGGWVFTYAVDAVIAMVARLHAALEPSRKHVADSIVRQAIETAIEMTKAMAHKNNMDLSLPLDKQRHGWPMWIAQTHALLQAHLQGDLWQFKDGKPVGWRKEGGHWTHANIAALLAVAPDALENQKSLDELYAFADPVPAAHVTIPTGAVAGSQGAPAVDRSAKIAKDAFVGPGCRIGKDVVIESGASVWNSVIEKCTIRSSASVWRSIVHGGSVGEGTVVRSCRMENTAIGARSTAQCASMVDSSLADETTVSAFADVANTSCKYGTILGGWFHDVSIDVYLMSMHMTGGCSGMKAHPTSVTVDGRTVQMPAIPMLGGGSLIRGTRDKPVEMECCFLGSNAIVDAGTYIGFGSFILGQLGPDAGLLPFSISTDATIAHHQIGGVLTNMPSTILTHFIPWTYNAVGADLAPAVAEMMKQAMRDGISAIEHEQARRAKSQTAVTSSAAPALAKYKCLPQYTNEQLASGLATYKRWLDGGAYDMTYRGGELVLSSTRGQWMERTGSALWKAT